MGIYLTKKMDDPTPSALAALGPMFSSNNEANLSHELLRDCPIIARHFFGVELEAV